MDIINVEKLTFAYGDKTVINDLSFQLQAGAYTTLLGANGCGKSTLAKLLSGLLTPKSGKIFLNGKDIGNDDASFLREKIGIVFQNPDNQFIGSTVKDDMAFGLENHRVAPEDMDPIIQEYAAYVGMEAYLDKEPGNLSGGQKQRVAIGGVLAMKPDILILDEATSMLDPEGKNDIISLIHRLHKERQLTIVAITHDIEEALLSDQCIVMADGQIIAQGEPKAILSQAEIIKKAHLRKPYIYALKERLEAYHINLKADTLEGMAEELWQSRSSR